MIIELSPLAYMRGRTLNNAVVILDEAQNTTIAQMKMFLTRIGRNAQAIITGDITQIDLPNKSASGLVHALSILKGIDDLEFVFFNEADIVRHPLVQKIITAYENNGE
jgi:phosphate starvation-inducible PhoH-like protein